MQKGTQVIDGKVQGAGDDDRVFVVELLEVLSSIAGVADAPICDKTTQSFIF